MFKLTSVLLVILIGTLYWLGLSINHLIMLSIFGGSIFLGALIIVDNEEETTDSKIS